MPLNPFRLGDVEPTIALATKPDLPRRTVGRYEVY